MRKLLWTVSATIILVLICSLVVYQAKSRTLAAASRNNHAGTPGVVATVIASGFTIQLQTPSLPAGIDRQTAIDIATRELTDDGSRVFSDPKAEYWLATNPEQTTTNPKDPEYMLDRPVWLVTFDKVEVQPSGGPAEVPGKSFPKLPDRILSKAQVFVDATTGEFLWLGADSLDPVTTPETDPNVCNKPGVAC